MYRMTVDYYVVHAATVMNTWLMPHINDVLYNIRGEKSFAVIEDTSKHCQLSMPANSQQLHAFMTHDGVRQPTKTTQGGCNSADNFQVCV